MKHVMSPAMRTRTGRRTLSPRDRWTVNIKQTRFCLGPGGRVPWYCVLVQGQIFRLLNFFKPFFFSCQLSEGVKNCRQSSKHCVSLVMIFSNLPSSASLLDMTTFFWRKPASLTMTLMWNWLIWLMIWLHFDLLVQLARVRLGLLSSPSPCDYSDWGLGAFIFWWRRKRSRRRELQDRRRCGAMFLSGIIELNRIEFIES